ncbi:MAG: glycoside hydrolase family 97 N-terminal domain-containing protein [Planctomycetia bacterium]|nr:glycoside hydrolase family 97 N-terminal domain-containing protein [Planctomycetia bacterium]
MKILSCCSALLLCLCLLSEARGQTEISSPDNRVRVIWSLDDGRPSYSLDFQGKQVVEKSVAWLALPDVEKASAWSASELQTTQKEWTPVYGETAVIPEQYNERTFRLTATDSEHEIPELQCRVYNEGLAFRWHWPDDAKRAVTIQKDATTFVLPAGTQAYPIFSTEGTFPRDPIALELVDGSVFSPMTVKLSDGVCLALLESHVTAWPRLVFPCHNSDTVEIAMPEETVLKPGDFSPWRVIMVAENEARLVENEFMTLNLNPPCTLDDTSWILPGKTLSNELNCPIQMESLLSMVDFAAAHAIRYIQIDWGWYGTEWCWSDEECDAWAKAFPDKAADPDWRRNAQGSPYLPAHGLVPYTPGWASTTTVDLDMPELIRYAREKNVGICLYINDFMLKKYDQDPLFAEYEKWGLAGLKPGFVAYGTGRNTEEIRSLVATAAAHRLWLCVHDLYLPDGMARTYPNLLTVEGGGGQEGWHPDFHDVTLPFTRGLAGPFDYTPALYAKDKSHTHQLSLLLTLYGPTHVIRSGWAIRNNTEEPKFGSELEFLNEVDSDWQATDVLDAKIGRYIILARKTKDGLWQLGATNGPEPYAKELELSFLDPDSEYIMTLWSDAEETIGPWRPAVKTEQTVRRGDRIALKMFPAGGAVALFKKK